MLSYSYTNGYLLLYGYGLLANICFYLFGCLRIIYDLSSLPPLLLPTFRDRFLPPRPAVFYLAYIDLFSPLSSPTGLSVSLCFYTATLLLASTDGSLTSVLVTLLLLTPIDLLCLLALSALYFALLLLH